MNEESDQLKTELSNLLAIDDFVLVEDSYAGQKWIDKTLDYMSKVKEADVLKVIRIYDERNELIGIAVRDKDLSFWMVFTDVIAEEMRKKEFETLAHKIKGAEESELVVEREKFHEGVIEFYSVGLVNRLFCDCNLKAESFYPRERVEVLKKALIEFLGEYGIDTGSNKKTLEIGCGDGGATIALHELGIFPFTIDVDKCEICKGLEEGILEPKKSIVLDCSLLSAFFGKEFDVVFGFMVGKLTPFERFGWEKVLIEVPKVLKSKGKVLLTVSSEEETGILDEILSSEFEAVIKENKESDGYLDQWVYTGELKD
ncbi:MAG: class I SAM-dependent methyltransferase [Euryarchaeota archaeon]|nr:class I SAM-dependent methyltransferase [Euryarchaeota archaeon]